MSKAGLCREAGGTQAQPLQTAGPPSASVGARSLVAEDFVL